MEAMATIHDHRIAKSRCNHVHSGNEQCSGRWRGGRRIMVQHELHLAIARGTSSEGDHGWASRGNDLPQVCKPLWHHHGERVALLR